MVSVFVGTLGLTLAALVALVFTIARGRVSVAFVPRIRLVSTAAILVQLAHFIEEAQHQFYVRFPELLGLAPWSRQFFLTFNLFWLAAWLLAVLGINAVWRISAFALWFLAIASMANGIVHPLLAFAVGGYFPGLWTSPFVGILGVVLFRAMRGGSVSERVLAQQ
jgi:hypothetical protein